MKTKTRSCPSCHGTGVIAETTNQLPCLTCFGKGDVEAPVQPVAPPDAADQPK